MAVPRQARQNRLHNLMRRRRQSTLILQGFFEGLQSKLSTMICKQRKKQEEQEEQEEQEQEDWPGRLAGNSALSPTLVNLRSGGLVGPTGRVIRDCRYQSSSPFVAV